MRRMWAAGAAIVMCLALGGLPVLGQGASPAEGGPVKVTATQTCTVAEPGGVLTATCTVTASDPRVTGEATMTVEGKGVMDHLQTVLSVLVGPEGTWTGRNWVIFDLAAGTSHAMSVQTGDGAYEGWTYVTSAMGSLSPSGDFVGLLYEGPPPPGITTGPLPSAASEPTASPSVEPLAQAEPAARWAAVTGTSSCSLGQAGVTQMDTQPYTWTNWVLRCLEAATDPRVSGPSTVVLNVESWDGREGLNAVAWWDYSIQGPDGTWDGHGYGLYDDEGVLHQSVILAGSGAYEGLTYTIAGTVPAGSSDSEFHGLIQPGSLPPGFPGVPLPEPTPSLSPAPSFATIGLPADDGARIVAVEEPDARTRDLTIESPSVGTVKVRLLLPPGFEPGAEARWPVLYLLHGAGDNDYTNWTEETDVAELTAELPLLVVMPEGGPDGWYADWWNGGAGGPPRWETFHTGELPELLERNWQASDAQAVAGYSAGGLGAMTYAARHPGLFRAAASFSGMLHPVILDPGIVGFDVPSALWGDRTVQADVWAAHDPVELAEALGGTALFVSYGDGEPGPLDAAGAGFDELEAAFAQMNEAFVARLAELGIPVTAETGPGTHTMPYVERGLHEALPMLLESLEM